MKCFLTTVHYVYAAAQGGSVSNPIYDEGKRGLELR